MDDKERRQQEGDMAMPKPGEEPGGSQSPGMGGGMGESGGMGTGTESGMDTGGGMGQGQGDMGQGGQGDMNRPGGAMDKPGMSEPAGDMGGDMDRQEKGDDQGGGMSGG